MKILITSDWYVPAVNGVVTSIINLKQSLEQRGHEVRVLTLSPNVHSDCKNGITRIGSVGAGLIYPGARLRASGAAPWLAELAHWRPDIIHSQCEFSTFFVARKMADALGVPLVHTYHTVYEDYTHYFSPSVRLGRHAAMRFSRWIADQVDVMIAPTQKVRTLLTEYGVSCPVDVVPSGLDLSRFSRPSDPAREEQLRRRLGLDENALTLVYLGRLAEEKNLDELCAALAACPDKTVRLLLVGDGPYRPALEEKVRELELGAQVVFAGMVPPAQVADYYRLGDLFVSASSSETQGLTYIEALASGLPTLCRADDCLTGIVKNGVNGWQYQSQQEFLAHIAWYAAHREEHAGMSAAAWAAAQPYAAEEFARRVEEIYFRKIMAYRSHNERERGFLCLKRRSA